MPNEADRPRRVSVDRDGPVLIEGPVELVTDDGTVVASDRFVVAVCTCRRSRTYPWCDTSHRRHKRPSAAEGGRTDPPDADTARSSEDHDDGHDEPRDRAQSPPSCRDRDQSPPPCRDRDQSPPPSRQQNSDPRTSHDSDHDQR